jgi:hypothetical protein
MVTKQADVKLGKNPPVHDSRTFSLGSYLTAALPAPDPTVDNYSAVSNWPMYDNDKWGDCTCAAAGHMVQAWTAAASAEVTLPDSAIDAMYEHFVGNPPPEDAGCNMLSVLKYWRQTGLGKTDKITAFAAVDLKNHDQLRTAVSLFGTAYIGVALPDDVCIPGKMLTTPWTVPASGAVGSAAPNPNNGHCIPAVGYDLNNVYVVTWGEVKTMSWDFYDAYADEAFAVLSPDYLKDGESEAGFNLAQLKSDLTGVAKVT